MIFFISMSGKDIAKDFRKASLSAGDRAMREGHSVVVKRGKRIVRLSPEGEEKVLKTLGRSFVVSAKKRFKVQ